MKYLEAFSQYRINTLIINKVEEAPFEVLIGVLQGFLLFFILFTLYIPILYKRL